MRPCRDQPQRCLPLWLPITAALLLLTNANPCSAAFEDRGPTLAGRSLGVNLSGDAVLFEGRTINPAAGGFLTGWGFTASAGRQFELTELNEARLDATLAREGWVVGLSANGLGDKLYRERSASVTLSRRFSPILALGVGVRHERLEIEGYGSGGRSSLDAGLLFRHRLFDAGLSINQLSAGELDLYSLPAPSPRLNVALCLPLPSDVMIYLESGWERERKTALGFGASVRFSGGVSFLAGYSSQSERIHIGLLLSLGNWSAGTGMDHHPTLGWSRVAGVTHRSGDEGSR